MYFRPTTYSTPNTARTAPVAIVRVSVKNLRTVPLERRVATPDALASQVFFVIAHTSPQPAQRQY